MTQRHATVILALGLLAWPHLPATAQPLPHIRLRAAFPAGTLSGAPKVRAMQIIDELEPTRRGPYGGAMGYFSFSGNLNTCITLRTIVVKDAIAYVQAGAGIVADSDPQSEDQECAHKARALLVAVLLIVLFVVPPQRLGEFFSKGKK